MDKTTRLGEESILKLLLKFSIPSMVGMLVNAIYNIVDRIFIGNSSDLGSLGLAGITVTFPLVIIMMAVSMLFGIGGSIRFSMRLGEKKPDEAAVVLGNSVTLLIISSLILMIAGLIFLKPVLLLFGATEETLPYASEYMRIILLGALFQSLGMGLNSFIRSDGHPKTSMFTMMIGAVVNIILDPIFIYILGWGMAGAALATIIGQMCSAVWAVLHFAGKNCTIRLRRKHMPLKADYVKQIMSAGTSAFILQSASCLLTVILNKTVQKHGGYIALSVIGIINSLATLLVLPVIGINQGSLPIISYNYGAQKFSRIKRTLFIAILLATCFTTAGFFITRIFGRQLISAFNSEPELVEFGIYAIKIWFMALPVVGFQIVGSNFFQAIGKVKQAMLLSTSRQIIFLIPLILILSDFWGLNGILYAVPAADVLAVCLTGAFLFREMRILGGHNT